LEETDIVVEEINERLKQFEDIIKVNYVSIGGSMDGISAGSKNVATFMIELISSTERDITTQQFVGDISDSVKDIAGAEITVKENDHGMSAGSPITLSISGDDLDVLKDLGQQV